MVQLRLAGVDLNLLFMQFLFACLFVLPHKGIKLSCLEETHILKGRSANP